MSDTEPQESDKGGKGQGFNIKMKKYDIERQKKALLRRKEEFESENGVLGRKLDGLAFECIRAELGTNINKNITIAYSTP